MTATAEKRTTPAVPSSNTGFTSLNLVNLMLRQMSHRITTTRIDSKLEDDPELFVVTRIDWKDRDRSRPILPQLPRILSILETLRGTGGIPSEIYLDSSEGIATYLPTGVRVSGIPKSPKKVVSFFIALVENTLNHNLSIINEVRKWFWKVARRRGFSPKILERMAWGELHYDSSTLLQKFHALLREYFSIRFTIQRTESCLRVEGGF
jgi:hypothetical protein